MDDAKTAFAVVQRFGQKTSDVFVRFVPVASVQVDMVLDRPATAPQIAQDVARQPGTQESVGVADGQARIDVEGAVQGLVDRGGFV